MAKKVDAESTSESGKPILKYPKPKVLLIDVGNSVASQLILDGFNITSGTFGKPYRVTKGDGFQPLVGRARLPNYNEQEIVVVDLAIKDLEPGPDGEKHTPQIEQDELAIGDGLAIEFEETVVNSMQVNGNKVEKAKAGDQTGLLWAANKPKIREGMRVFRFAR